MVLRLLNLASRTVQAFIPALSRPDDDFARHWLSSAEFPLFMRLDRRDRVHSIVVARQLLKLGVRERELVAAALLHDVAKALLPFNPLHRVAVHLYRPVGLPKEPLAPGFRGALQLREHHEELGAAMILAAGGSAAVARLVRDLAAPQMVDRHVALLRRADEAT